MRRLWRDYSLSLVLTALFLGSLILQAVFNYAEWQEETLAHGQALEVGSYLTYFLGRVFENAQSEFLQLLSFVVLSCYLIHRNSPQSRDGDDEMQAKIDRILQRLEDK